MKCFQRLYAKPYGSGDHGVIYEKEKFVAGDRVLLTTDKQKVQKVQGDSFVKRMLHHCGKPGVVQRVAVSNTLPTVRFCGFH